MNKAFTLVVAFALAQAVVAKPSSPTAPSPPSTPATGPVVESTVAPLDPPLPPLRTQPTSPTIVRPTSDELATFQVATIVIGSMWLAAVVDTENHVGVKSLFKGMWPRGADDLDVDAATALRRRALLYPLTVRDHAPAFPRVIAACAALESPGEGTWFLGGDEGIVEVRASFLLEPLARARLVPLLDPVVVVHRGEPAATLRAQTKARPCVNVFHTEGGVRFPPEAVTLTLPKPESPTVTRFPCSDRASILVAAEAFVRLFQQPSRDTVHALPVPSSHASLAMFEPPLLPFALREAAELRAWLDLTDAERQLVADEAALAFSFNDNNTPQDGGVTFRRGERLIDLRMSVFDGTCRLQSVPSHRLQVPANRARANHGAVDWVIQPMGRHDPVVRYVRRGDAWKEAPGTSP
jgi:hypothetical protein